MPFESCADVPVPREFLDHVWEEEDLVRGGHRSGIRRFTKTEFPQNWSFLDMENAIKKTLALPQYVRVTSSSIICDREICRVIVRVILWKRSSGLKLHAAYPVCGDGVVRNEPQGSVLLPLDLYRWEA